MTITACHRCTQLFSLWHYDRVNVAKLKTTTAKYVVFFFDKCRMNQVLFVCYLFDVITHVSTTVLSLPSAFWTLNFSVFQTRQHCHIRSENRPHVWSSLLLIHRSCVNTQPSFNLVSISRIRLRKIQPPVVHSYNRIRPDSQYFDFAGSRHDIIVKARESRYSRWSG